MTLPTQAALIVTVPEADPIVGDTRARHDPAAAEGVPAHVTVLYPFIPPERITKDVLGALADVIAKLPTFRAEFSELRQFPGTLYLAPEPADSFRRLTEAIVARFPEAPPYGGQFSDIVPHLSVAHAKDPQHLAGIESEFMTSTGRLLPIRTVVRHVTLIEKSDGRWHTRLLLPLLDDSPST